MHAHAGMHPCRRICRVMANAPVQLARRQGTYLGHGHAARGRGAAVLHCAEAALDGDACCTPPLLVPQKLVGGQPLRKQALLPRNLQAVHLWAVLLGHVWQWHWLFSTQPAGLWTETWSKLAITACTVVARSHGVVVENAFSAMWQAAATRPQSVRAVPLGARLPCFRATCSATPASQDADARRGPFAPQARDTWRAHRIC